jgi:hypothetical protein
VLDIFLSMLFDGEKRQSGSSPRELHSIAITTTIQRAKQLMWCESPRASFFGSFLHLSFSSLRSTGWLIASSWGDAVFYVRGRT